MTTRNPANWMPELIGPVNIEGDGTAAERRRGGLNFVGATLEDDPDNDRINVTLPGGGDELPDPTGHALDALAVNAAGDGYELVDVVDVPALAGNGGKAVAVNSGATALEYVACTGTGSFVRATQPTIDRPVVHEIEDPSSHSVSINGNGVAQWGPTGMICGIPRLGVPGAATYDGVSFPDATPYSSEGHKQVNIFNAGGTHFTVASGDYSRSALRFTSATGARSVYFPWPQSEDEAFAMDLDNASGQTVTVCVNDAQPSAVLTVTMANGAKGRYWFTTDGVYGPFSASAGGSVGGADTQVLFNDGGTEAGDAGLTFDKTTNFLSVTGGLNVGSGTTHASATIRLPYAASDVVIGAPNNGGTDYPVLHRTAANSWRFGDATGWNTSVYGDVVTFYGASGTTMYAPGGSVVAIEFAASANIGLFDGAGFGSGSKVLSVANATTAPTTNPTGGAIWYVEGGASKARGSGGTVTTFGPAEPHCPTCGRDFATEHRNDEMGEHLAVCLPCLIDTLKDAGIDTKKFAMVDKRGAGKAAWDENHAKAKVRTAAAEADRQALETSRRMALAREAALRAVVRDARKDDES